MKKIVLVLLGVAGISSTLFIYSCSENGQKKSDEKTANSKEVNKPEDLIAKGQHLVTIMGCNDCHSPKKMGPQGPEIISDLMLSGYPEDRPLVKFDTKLMQQGFSMMYPDLTAAAGPWGVSFAGNLTPDDTGIGNWTEEQFKKALTQGKFKGLDGSRNLLPPMPWMNYKTLSDGEIHAIFSYLKSLKPVKNIVPAPVSPDKM